MGYYVSSMIGIRTGGVFSAEPDMKALKGVIKTILKAWPADERPPIKMSCISRNLVAGKGSYVVLAGVFNDWRFPAVSEFAAKLSVETGAEVMVMVWDEQQDQIQCQVFLDGHSLFDVHEEAVGKIIRRIT